MPPKLLTKLLDQDIERSIPAPLRLRLPRLHGLHGLHHFHRLHWLRLHGLYGLPRFAGCIRCLGCFHRLHGIRCLGCFPSRLEPSLVQNGSTVRAANVEKERGAGVGEGRLLPPLTEQGSWRVTKRSNAFEICRTLWAVFAGGEGLGQNASFWIDSQRVLRAHSDCGLVLDRFRAKEPGDQEILVGPTHGFLCVRPPVPPQECSSCCCGGLSVANYLNSQRTFWQPD
jgi:hypothetical protein